MSLELNNELSIPLAVPSFGLDEIEEAIDSLRRKEVTMGGKVEDFESAFAEYLDVEHAIMVNSGSSANLLAAKILSNPSLNDPIESGDQVIVPAVSWSTSLFPFLDVQAEPVLVDVKDNTYSLDPDRVDQYIVERTKAIMLVHPFGYPCDLDGLLEIADENGLYVIEDSCEAIGTKHSGKHVGTFGDIGTFSFYFSHHISTIEGGMVVTNSDEYARLAKIMRAHGWSRDVLSDGQNRGRSFHENFEFVNTGYNLRPTEIQGAFGKHQVKKIPTFVSKRRDVARRMRDELDRFDDWLELPAVHEEGGDTYSFLGFPILVGDGVSRGNLVTHLEDYGIETRPMIAGNLAEQPFMELFGDCVKVTDLPVARRVMRDGFFIGSHHAIGEDQIEYLGDVTEEFFRTYD